MGITLSLLEKLQKHGVLGNGEYWRVLDIGSSNLYQADNQGVIAFVQRFRPEEGGISKPSLKESPGAQNMIQSKAD